MISREQILKARRPRKLVRIDEWGGDILIEAWSVRRRTEALDIILTNQRDLDLYAADQALDEEDREGIAEVSPLDQGLVQLIHSVINEDGSLMFSMEDYSVLEELSYAATVELWKAFVEVNSTAKPTSETEETLKKSSD